MPDAFVPLAVLLARSAPDASPVEALEPEPVTLEPDVPDDAAVEQLASEVRRFRARLHQAFENALAGLLRDLACNVLARELELQPADLQTLISEVLASVGDVSPLQLRACESECHLLEPLGLPVSADAALRSGDAIVELRDGELDLSLGIRLEALLRGVVA